MEKLIEKLIKSGHLKTSQIIDAFKKIHRRDFLPEGMEGEEEVNAPLPISCGQTISQPLTVAFMLEILEPHAGQKILDIGSGSGWSTTLLAELVGKKGHVYAIERIVELKEFGCSNVAKYNFANITFYTQDGSKGLPDVAPFDRILVSAAAKKIPQVLKDQLKIGGRLVIPTSDENIKLVERISKTSFKETAYPGFIFVPLVEG